MKAHPRPRWFFLYFCAVVIGVGLSGLWYFSTPNNAKVRLKAGETGSLLVVRLNSQPADLSLFFDRVFGQERPELGHLDSELLVKNGSIELRQPGVLVKLQIEIGNAHAIYEALPGRGADWNYWRRQLVPFVDDGEPRRVPWPPSATTKPVINPGVNVISVTVVEVGAQLENEVVTFSLAPPIQRSRAQPGYEFLLWFIYWPIYGPLLVIYAWVNSMNRTPNRVARE